MCSTFHHLLQQTHFYCTEAEYFWKLFNYFSFQVMNPRLICTQTEDNYSSLLKFLQDLNRDKVVHEQVTIFSLSTVCINETDLRFHNWHFQRDNKDFHFLSMSFLGVVLFSIRTTVCFQLVKLFLLLYLASPFEIKGDARYNFIRQFSIFLI